MSVDQITAIAAMALSLGFSYLPGLKTWYEKRLAQQKRLIMLGLLALVVAGVYVSSCTGLGDLVACEGGAAAIALEALALLITAAVANQGTYLLTKRG